MQVQTLEQTPKKFNFVPVASAASCWYDTNKFVLVGGNGVALSSMQECHTLTGLVTNLTAPNISEHSTVFSFFTDSLYVFGGDKNNNLYIYSCKSKEWRICKPKNAPQGRSFHTAVINRTRMYVFGGTIHSKSQNDHYEFDLCTEQWKQLPSCIIDGMDVKRAGHSCVNYQGRLIYFGGSFACNGVTTMEYSIEKQMWQRVKTSGKAPGDRAHHGAVLHKQNMYIVAGVSYAAVKSLWCLNLETNQWNLIALQAEFPYLSHFAMQLMGERVYIIGGHGKKGEINKKLYMIDLCTRNVHQLALSMAKQYQFTNVVFE